MPTAIHAHLPGHNIGTDPQKNVNDPFPSSNKSQKSFLALSFLQHLTQLTIPSVYTVSALNLDFLKLPQTVFFLSLKSDAMRFLVSYCYSSFSYDLSCSSVSSSWLFDFILLRYIIVYYY